MYNPCFDKYCYKTKQHLKKRSTHTFFGKTKNSYEKKSNCNCFMYFMQLLSIHYYYYYTYYAREEKKVIQNNNLSVIFLFLFEFIFWGCKMAPVLRAQLLFKEIREISRFRTMYDFHDSTDTLKFWTEKQTINKKYIVFHLIWWNLVKLQLSMQFLFRISKCQ